MECMAAKLYSAQQYSPETLDNRECLKWTLKTPVKEGASLTFGLGADSIVFLGSSPVQRRNSRALYPS